MRVGLKEKEKRQKNIAFIWKLICTICYIYMHCSATLKNRNNNTNKKRRPLDFLASPWEILS